MSTFQDRIKSTLARVVPAQGTNQGPVAPFDRVLNEFVETLTSEWPFVGAAIEGGSPPQMRSLVTWPRLRRDERSIMLTFWWEGTAMRVLNEKGRPPFQAPEALSDYLIDFLENSAFPGTLAEYERRCKEDVDGFLRAKGLTEASAEDVTIIVQAAEQEKIANATPGNIVNIVVTPERFPGTAEYNDTGNYAHLSSGGFGLRLMTHGMAGGKIHVSGVVMDRGETT
jgi:hypothetical protein